MWFGLWYGGNGYSTPELSDLEEFPSLADAGAKLIARHRDGYWRRSRFAFVDRDPADVLTPCVGDDCEIWIYRSRESLDYPDRRLWLGPRGGIRSESC
ncbi:hypothetical protein ACFSKW_26930 [Nonomuraea mangrovi]|uniref:Uncharacterized protein n=1 Tax=Nonomuraea mangrovi TaxID=2316207 RepID=A0ABW4T3V2_9ACTN